MADLHGVVEVFHDLCVPHFYHAMLNSLIINELHILHREVKTAYKPYASITKPHNFLIIKRKPQNLLMDSYGCFWLFWAFFDHFSTTFLPRVVEVFKV